MLSPPLDAISLILTVIPMSIEAVFLPRIIADLLATLQDVIPWQNFSAWPGRRWGSGGRRPWLPFIAASLIPNFMILEVLYFLQPWLSAFVDLPLPTSLGLFSLAYVPFLVVLMSSLVMQAVGELMATHCMAHLSRKFRNLQVRDDTKIFA